MLKLFGCFSSTAGYKQGWGIIKAENFEISKVGSLKRMCGVIFNSKYVLSLSYKKFHTVLYIKLVLLLEKKKKRIKKEKKHLTCLKKTTAINNALILNRLDIRIIVLHTLFFNLLQLFFYLYRVL